MKICGIICEYNPFHNGHAYQIAQAKQQSGADAILCVMSGNFVQRGESAVIDKYTRAKHAVLAGADIVVELPTVFATSNAEIFAKGAIRLLASIPHFLHLCFGAENADKDAFLSTANALNNEPKTVSDRIKRLMSTGKSYARARAEAWQDQLPQALLCSPNNILGLEYTKALLKTESTAEILPVGRVGSGYTERKLSGEYASATAIRNAIGTSEDFSKYLPEFVLNELPKQPETLLPTLEKYAILARSKEEIAQTPDCGEGLENALKDGVERGENDLVETLTSARYTSARIRRILLQNLLQIDRDILADCLQSPLYLRVLAVKKERTDVLSALSESTFPILARAYDDEKLCATAKRCLQIDRFAESVHKLLYPNAKKEKSIFY
ncbi:MAG: nucleotidyltransferase family protein [Clostridia bacterium]|nr:nucleotidyltransferase family protein [Clostridia bacterium]